MTAHGDMSKKKYHDAVYIVENVFKSRFFDSRNRRNGI